MFKINDKNTLNIFYIFFTSVSIIDFEQVNVS